MAKINPHTPSHAHPVQPAKGTYPRELDTLRNGTQTAAESFFIDFAPNYAAKLQTAQSQKKSPLRGRVTGRPSNPSAGKADMAVTKQIFKNRSHLTLVAPRLPGQTPF